MKKSALALISLLGLCSCFDSGTRHSDQSSSSTNSLSNSQNPQLVPTLFSKNAPRQIIAIVPSWASESAKLALEQGMAGTPVDQILTRLHLQFWNLGTDGVLSNDSPEITPWLVTWAKAHKIDLLMAPYNAGPNGWDWDLLRQQFKKDRGQSLITQMLKIVDSLDLAGVDLDFEGDASSPIPYDSVDQNEYVFFCKVLSDSLHHRGKLLAIDTYPNGNGAPKSTWWSDLSFADHIQSMTLEQIWATGPGDRNYSALFQKANAKTLLNSQFSPILPMFMASWSGSMIEQGPNALENIQSFLNCMPSNAGIALFPFKAIDENAKWKDPKIWQTLALLKNGQQGQSEICQAQTSSPWIIDDFNNNSVNLAGGIWIGDTDFWIRLNQFTPPNDTISGHQTYTDEQDAWNHATRVWNAKMDYDLAIQNQRWADFGNAYQDEHGLRIIKALFEVSSPISTIASQYQNAFASLVMEFMPRNCDNAPDACWEITKTGQSRDLSAFRTLNVGIRCTAGKTVNIFVNSLDHPYDNYGIKHPCNGSWENISMDLDNVPALHQETGKFDKSQAFRLNLGYENQGQKDTCALDLAGVAMDHNVLEWKGITP